MRKHIFKAIKNHYVATAVFQISSRGAGKNEWYLLNELFWLPKRLIWILNWSTVINHVPTSQMNITKCIYFNTYHAYEVLIFISICIINVFQSRSRINFKAHLVCKCFNLTDQQLSKRDPNKKWNCRLVSGFDWQKYASHCQMMKLTK